MVAHTLSSTLVKFPSSALHSYDNLESFPMSVRFFLCEINIFLRFLLDVHKYACVYEETWFAGYFVVFFWCLDGFQEGVLRCQFGACRSAVIRWPDVCFNLLHKLAFYRIQSIVDIGLRKLRDCFIKIMRCLCDSFWSNIADQSMVRSGVVCFHPYYRASILPPKQALSCFH